MLRVTHAPPRAAELEGLLSGCLGRSFRGTGGEAATAMGVLADLADELKYDRERQLQFGAFRA